MSFNTPILIIAFNRPDKIKKILHILSKLKPEKIFLSVDGPRLNNMDDRKKCNEVKNLFSYFDWDCTVARKYEDINLGCKINVIKSIDWFFELNDEGIILEDDCLPSISFFYFCEKMLNKYNSNYKIMHINGSNLGIDFSNFFHESYFFSKLNHVWGWATWKRSWKFFNRNFSNYKKLKNNKVIKKYFSNRDIYNWMINYYEKSYNGKDNIWSTNWSFSIVEEDGLCISPSKNLVRNIGFDGSGTSGGTRRFKKLSEVDIHEIENFNYQKNINYNIKYDLLTYNDKILPVDDRANKTGFLKKIYYKIFK